MITFTNTINPVGNDPRIKTVSDKTPGATVQLLRTKFEIYVGDQAAMAVWRRANDSQEAELWNSEIRAAKTLERFCNLPKIDKTIIGQPTRTTKLTGWSQHAGTFTTFTTTGRTITNITSSSTEAWFKSNDFTLTKGDIVVLGLRAGTLPAGMEARLYKGTTLKGSTSSDLPVALNGINFFVADESGTDYTIRIGKTDATYTVQVDDLQITTIPAGQYPVAYFKIKATEYWEDENNEVQKGNTIETPYALFIPIAKDQTKVFKRGETRTFPSESSQTGIKFQSGNEHIWPLLFASQTFDIKIYYKHPTVAETTAIDATNIGWGILHINDDNFPNLATKGSIEIQARDHAGALSGWLLIESENSCDLFALIFIGENGAEYIPFRNDDSLKIASKRETWKNEYGVNLPVRNEVTNIHTLRTVYETDETVLLLAELLKTLFEVYINGDQADNLECGVAESDIQRRDQRELITNTIQVQYAG